MSANIPSLLNRILLVLALVLLHPAALSQEKYLSGETFQHDLPGGDKGPEMVVVREGSFVLGGGRQSDSEEALVVEIPRPFAVSTTEITVGMYLDFLNSTRSADAKALAGVDEKLPVSGVSWDEAESYVTWLSHQTGKPYRLPSSTQWEYAARAGSRGAYSWAGGVGSGKANCVECGVAYDGELAPVGSFKANAWGLYDVHGNVWEWTRDCIDPNSKPPLNGMPQLFGNCDLRELRGGSAQSDAWSIRANARAYTDRKAKLADVGMRVIMEIPE